MTVMVHLHSNQEQNWSTALQWQRLQAPEEGNLRCNLQL